MSKRPTHKELIVANNLLTENWLISIIYSIGLMKSFYKFIVHLITGKCELERLLEKYDGCQQILLIENCLYSSKVPILNSIHERKLSDVDQFVKDVMIAKKIKAEQSFKAGLTHVINQLTNFEKFYIELENLRTQKYCCGNETHEKNLLELWSLMQPGRKLTKRKCKDWGDIGFQGEDPATDFRGMGILGLNNLIYFAKNYNKQALKALQHSHHPKYGYSYAIVGINITSMTYDLISNGLLKSQFLMFIDNKQSYCFDDYIILFNQIYCYLLSSFDDFWIKSEPENVMMFGEIRKKFEEQIYQKLIELPLNTKLLLNP